MCAGSAIARISSSSQLPPDSELETDRLVWLLIAVVVDYVFIVKAFKSADGYYKPDVYVYCALTLAIPLVAGWRKDVDRAR